MEQTLNRAYTCWLFLSPKVEFDGPACNSRLIELKLHSLSRLKESLGYFFG
jgi:hypothetical protein